MKVMAVVGPHCSTMRRKTYANLMLNQAHSTNSGIELPYGSVHRPPDQLAID